MSDAPMTCEKCRALYFNSLSSIGPRCFCPLEQAAKILREGLTGPLTIWDRIAPNLAELLAWFHLMAVSMGGRDSAHVPDAALRIARTIVEHGKERS